MFRNLFAIFATLMLGAGAASAATTTTDPTGQSLEQRIQAAQRIIDRLMAADDEQAAQGDSKKVVQYWSNYYRPWHNWNNWNNWRNYHQPYRY